MQVAPKNGPFIYLFSFVEMKKGLNNDRICRLAQDQYNRR